MDTTKSLQDSRYDVIRTMALGMILICHLAPHFSSRLMIPLHDVFAQIGNCTFFALSGVLLGRKWLVERCRDYGTRFVLHRVVKLGIPFLIFMIPYIVLLLLTGHSLSPLQVVLNLLGLSWFAKLPDAGHLWFVSAILIFYLTLVPLSRIGAWIREHTYVTLSCSFVLALGVQFALWYLGVKQAYLIPLLWGGGGYASCMLIDSMFPSEVY